jgi:hypothetical protein
MASSEVQRTLVKSPPELWAELSDPATLARHLGELGEIRITRVEPEQKVEWTAEDTTGTVLIDPSGWGTRVTLTATREVPEAESHRASSARAEIDAAQATLPEAAGSSDPEVTLPAEPEATTQGRRGFFARLLRRRRPVAPPSFESEDGLEQSTEPADAFAAVARALAPETLAAARPFASAHLSAPAQVESARVKTAQALGEQQAESWDDPQAQVTAVLTSVLDRLGAAHHRPFSRA